MRAPALALLCAASGAALAQVALPLPERMDQPPAPPGPHYTGRASPGQVNVNANGQNIIGDAANEPSLAVDPTAPNRIVIGWRQFDSVNSNFRQAGMGWSNDGGRTWHASVLDPGNFRSDPILRANAEGTIYYNMLNVNGSTYRADVYRTTDGGRTWSGPVFAYGGDKVWFVVDRTASPGHGYIYAAWNPAGNNYGTNTFNRSTDGGLSFAAPTTIPGQPRFGTLAIGPAGQLYIAGYDSEIVTSTNPWTASPTFANHVISGWGSGASSNPNPGGLAGQAQVVVDRSGGARNGWVYMLGSRSTSNPADPADVLLTHSTDGGTTWSVSTRVNPDPRGANSYQWFGTIGIAPNGRLDVVWNDTSQSQTANLSRTVYSSSSDGGVSWTTPVALTPQWDSFVGWPQQNKIGDYYDIESDNVGADLAFAATLNGEQDVYYRRLGPYDCNRNGVDDAADIASGTAHDCNGNGIPDSCEIAADPDLDRNHNGVLDRCEGTCSADFNGDGDVGTDADIQAFFACIAGNCCATCGSADFNGDGDVGTDADIESFFRVLAGGPC
jgi:hypothetical protein